MGRKKKFGEESDFVSVRVPKSKRREYRNAIKHFVEEKFATESESNNEELSNATTKDRLEGFRKFEEFINQVKNTDEEKDYK